MNNNSGINITGEDIMDIKFKLKRYLGNLLQNVNLGENEISVLDSSDTKFGDLSTNLAMVLAGKSKENPREIAQSIVDNINSDENKPDYISTVEVAGPGFINFFLSNEYLLSNLKTILREKDDFGKYEIGKDRKVMIEYGQPNTHKAFHIGHVKSAISGLAMINLFSNFGFDVIKANFYGDVGMQVAKCLWGVQKIGVPNGLDDKSPDEKISFIQEAYVKGAKAFADNKDAEKEIRSINIKVYSKEDPDINKLYELTRKWSRQHLEEVFKILNVEYDREYPESEIAEIGKQLVLDNVGTVFKEDQGAIIFEGEKYGLHNRVFISSEGNVTYEGKDMALGNLKSQEYDLEQSYIFTGLEQNDYFDVVIKALETLNPTLKGKSHHIGFGHLLMKGKKESSRSGISITGKELIMQMIDLANQAVSERQEFDEEQKDVVSKTVGLGALRYMILKHPFHVSFSFDPDEALSLSGKSAPYVMYSYTRAMSIIREWSGDPDDLLQEEIDLDLRKDELKIAKMLSKYENIVLDSLNNLSPHFIANYIYEVAQEFNKFYSENQVLNAEDEKVKNLRLLITFSTAQILKNGLNLLGIDVLERM